ncbi:hypothetical protein AMTRI_Chr08g207510 [Amborella trichopoda]|uniref:Wound-induced protein 1 n=1 Tax=Amborella trichopoda TaxID=13333 RepID=W1NJG9_AMBTC|nr:wound-induced protein 1 [Amborella trichopoda]ERM95606.1 hypothetical protein AMTR_s00023p00141210 [Amborella trichopoda]|eukprot:XP_006828190.1 wound-induced protein 1 [Amborella trichopoda]
MVALEGNPVLRAEEDANKATVMALYAALDGGDCSRVAEILAPDLEWWFHGPPHCQYMKHMLTGESIHHNFTFKPQSVRAIGSMILAEGWEGEHMYWVHVWSVVNGLITQVREYFNTWIIVRDLSPVVLKAQDGCEGLTLWRSEVEGRWEKSLPGLVLAI